MNKKHRKQKQNNAAAKASQCHSNIGIAPTAEAKEGGPKRAEQGENAAALHQISRWQRFMKWLFTATVAEVGMFLLTLVIAGSGIYYTKYAKRQWKAMHESNEINRENVESVQRALVFFSGQTGIAKRITGTRVSTLTILVPWLNTGVTPATEGKSVVNWQTLPSPFGLPQNFAYPDLANTKPVRFEIPPKGSGNATMDVPIHWIEDTKNKKFRMFIYGWITYRDIFSRTPIHLSEFCSEITNIDSGPKDVTDPTANIAWELSLCSEHNCSDERCSDYREKTP
jgi:hypothetical protein